MDDSSYSKIIFFVSADFFTNLTTLSDTSN